MGENSMNLSVLKYDSLSNNQPSALRADHKVVLNKSYFTPALAFYATYFIESRVTRLA